MRTYKKIYTFMIIFLIIIIPIIPSEPAISIIDGEDDVVTFPDPFSDIEDYFFTNEKPNIDIKKISYLSSENSKEVTIILIVKGVIEDRNDFENINLTDDITSFFGVFITYYIGLETSYGYYNMEYSNKTCTVNGENATYTVNGSVLTVTFNLETDDETFTSFYCYTSEFNISSLTDFKFYMDGAPDEIFFIGSIKAPVQGEIGQPLTFIGTFEDILKASTPPYTYMWDWGDGSDTEYGQHIIHTYLKIGDYTITLTVEDSMGLQTIDKYTINIIKRSNIYDVNFDGVVDFTDIILIWRHRRDALINPLFDVNNDNKVNLIDIWLVFKNRS